MITNPIFETERLIVRPWTMDDAQAYFDIYSDPAVMAPLLAQPVGDLESARLALGKRLEAVKADPPGMGFFAIVPRALGRPVGSSILRPLPNDTRVEVGWHLGSQHWDRGYATESGAGAIGYGFSTLGLEEIFAIVREENLRSRRVCERIGLAFVEMTDRYHNLNLRLYRIARGP